MTMIARTLLLIPVLLIAACAHKPPFEAAGARMDMAPYQAGEAPQRIGDRAIWGGMIMDVVNRRDNTEITVLAYPLDEAYRPLLKAPNVGRFILVLPGYVERLDWPEGRFLSARGEIVGSRETMIDERPYVYPVLRSEVVHLWSAGFQSEGPHFSIGIGVGIR